MRYAHRWWQRLFVGAGMVGAMAGAGAITAAPIGAATDLSNGSFETPVIAPNTFQTFYTGQSIGAWKVTAGNVDLSGVGFWQVADGVQSLDLNGNTNGAITQTFSTAPLVTYEVSYALAGNPHGGPAVKTGKVLINDKVAQDFSFDITGKTPAKMGYVTKEFIFTASGPSTTLQFSSTTSPSVYGPVIDNVKVESCLIIICLSDRK